ncbi:uncharacterized protein [Ciconia boyciana]
MMEPRRLGFHFTLLSELAGLILVPSLPVQWYLLQPENNLLQPCKLVKGKKKKPLPNLKTLEYVVQFPGLYATSSSVLLRQPVANSRNRTWAEHAVSVQPFHILFIKSLRTCFTEMFRYLISIDSLSLGT